MADEDTFPVHIRYRKNGTLREIELNADFLSPARPELISEIQMGTGVFDESGREIFSGDRLYDTWEQKEYLVGYVGGAFVAMREGQFWPLVEIADTALLYPAEGDTI